VSVSWTYRMQVAAYALRRLLPSPLKAMLARGLYSPAASELDQGEVGGDRPTVICLPIIDWTLRTQRPQHLLAGLARAGMRAFYVRKELGRGDAATLGTLAPGVTGVTLPGRRGESIYVGVPRRNQLDRWLVAFDQLRARCSLADVVVLVQWPYWWPLAEALRQRWNWRIVYDCLDEHSAHPATGAEVIALEAELIRRADLVLASARALYARCSKTARRCELLPNACEYEHFARRGPGPNPLARVRRPIVGYYGALAEWFAPEMLEHAARHRPDWQFVLIGLNSGADLRTIGRYSNVHLLGERRYARLPAFLHGFDVATIPFRVTPLTLATNPVKLFEYFATGKPVVATALPELEGYRELCYLAQNPAQMTAQIAEALDERPGALAQRRVEVARANTGDARVARLAALLDEVRSSAAG
jgi:glycosyltransferase involved in cell wall biosynthesis